LFESGPFHSQGNHLFYLFKKKYEDSVIIHYHYHEENNFLTNLKLSERDFLMMKETVFLPQAQIL